MRKDIEKIKQYLKDNRNDDNIYEKINQMDIGVQDKVLYSLLLNGWENKVQHTGIKVLEDFRIFDYYVFPAARNFFAVCRIDYKWYEKSGMGKRPAKGETV